MSRRFKEPLIERAYLFELYKSQLISVRFLKRVQVIDTTIIMMISYKTTGTNTQASTTTTGFLGALDNGHATVPAPGSETTGLPEKVVASINSINEGGSISEATGLKEFAEYKAVGKTLALITTDAQGKISDVPTKVRIYVPNMVEGKDIKVIAYANITGNWAPTEVFGINHQDKTLDTLINGSSTICVVYK